MAPSLLHLPNGQVINVKPIFGGLRFEPQDLNIHKSPFPPGWIIILNTDGESAAEPSTDQGNAAPEEGRPTASHRYKRPTLNKDSMFISSISNPATSDFKPALSQSRQIAMMLWTSLYWYFHQARPDPQSITVNANAPREAQPKRDWTIRIKREGIFKGRHLMSKLERMGLAWSLDSCVGLDDASTGEGFQELFVSQRSFWQIDARLFLFTLSPIVESPFVSSPYSSRPNSPSRLSYHSDTGSLANAVPMSPRMRPNDIEGQNYGLWAPPTPGPFQSSSHTPTFYPAPPAHFTMTNNVRHPVRPKPPRPGETFYMRYIPSQKQYLSFRAASASDTPSSYRGPLGNGGDTTSRASSASYSELALIPNDICLLHKWMNNERVAAAWGETGPREHQEKFLINNLKSRHSFPVIGCWDGKPFGYFEVYWVKEDLLGSYVDGVGHWDRGIHLLVGEDEFRGRERFRIWASALMHWMWVSDPRTQSLYLEPRVDNEKILGYLQDVGFHKDGEVALPHKQSNVMKISRDSWEAPFL